MSYDTAKLSMLPPAPQEKMPTPPIGKVPTITSISGVLLPFRKSERPGPLTTNCTVPVLVPALAEPKTVNELVAALKKMISAKPLLVRIAPYASPSLWTRASTPAAEQLLALTSACTVGFNSDTTTTCSTAN